MTSILNGNHAALVPDGAELDRAPAPAEAAGAAAVENGAIAALRRLRRRREVEERCELCGAAVPGEPGHEHLMDLRARSLVCSCTACALLFDTELKPVGAEPASGPAGPAGPRLHRVPRRLWRLTDFVMTDQQWEGLAIPVKMAFLVSSPDGISRRAYYPSPAGATESHLSPEAWAEIVADNPVLTGLQPEVEALLVNRVGGRREHYIAPIDRCYALVGLIRTTWRGLGGGDEVWLRIGEYFDVLRAAARERSVSHA